MLYCVVTALLALSMLILIFTPPIAEGKSPTQRDDSSMITRNEDVIKALHEGLKVVQKLLRILNMAPCQQKMCFNILWVEENKDLKDMALEHRAKLFGGDDGDAQDKAYEDKTIIALLENVEVILNLKLDFENKLDDDYNT